MNWTTGMVFIKQEVGVDPRIPFGGQVRPRRELGAWGSGVRTSRRYGWSGVEKSCGGGGNGSWSTLDHI